MVQSPVKPNYHQYPAQHYIKHEPQNSSIQEGHYHSQQQHHNHHAHQPVTTVANVQHQNGSQTQSSTSNAYYQSHRKRILAKVQSDCQLNNLNNNSSTHSTNASGGIVLKEEVVDYYHNDNSNTASNSSTGGSGSGSGSGSASIGGALVTAHNSAVNGNSRRNSNEYYLSQQGHLHCNSLCKENVAAPAYHQYVNTNSSTTGVFSGQEQHIIYSGGDKRISWAPPVAHAQANAHRRYVF